MNSDTPSSTAVQTQRRHRRVPWRRIVRWTGIGLVASLLLIQLFPYGRDHSNPPVTQAVVWDQPRTEQLARQACYACHSNETTWPWYSNVAPVSWLVQQDVDEGREKLNFSEWDRAQDKSDDSVETIQEGGMPLWYYTITHSDARLSAQEKQDLIDGFIATFGTDGD